MSFDIDTIINAMQAICNNVRGKLLVSLASTGTALKQWYYGPHNPVCGLFLGLVGAFYWLVMTLPHIFWGILRSAFHTGAGFVRPGPDHPVEEATVNKGYAAHPYSVWRGVFMAYVWELAGMERVNRGEQPPTHITLDVNGMPAPPWLQYNPKSDFFSPIPKVVSAAREGDCVAACLGVTPLILQQAGKETRDRLTAELSTMMTVCTFIGGFIFTTLVNPPIVGGGGPAGSNKTMIMLQSNITGTTTRYYRGASMLSVSGLQTNSTETSLGAGGNSNGTASWDAYGLLAGLTLVMALTCVGIYARLLVLLQWSATTTSLYRLIAAWERAMSGNQLMFFAVLSLSYASALAACWDRYGGSSHWVFMVLVVATGVCWWFFANFWAHSMWWREDGIMQKYSRLYHERLIGQEQGMFKNGCSLLPQKMDVARTKYTFYGLLDQHLLGKNYP